MGNTVLMVGPTLGITFSTPASKALARTSLTPRSHSAIPQSKNTARELMPTPTIQLLSASPQSVRIWLARRR